MAQVNSNILGNALQTKINPQILQPQKAGNNTSTPAFPVFKPNTSINVAYGGSPSVATESYSNNQPSYTPPPQPSVYTSTPTPFNPVKTTSTTQTTSTPNQTQGGPTTQQNPAQAPYDTTTGRLTDYGRQIGAKDVNAPQQPQGPTPTPQPGGLYGKFINQGANYLDQAGKVAGEAGQLRQAIQGETNNVMNNPYYSGSVRVGQAGQIQQNQGAQLTGLTAEQQALTQQGNAYITGANASAPVQVPYSNQYIDPTTGLPVNGGSGGNNLSPDAQQAITTYAAQVKAGTMTRADAEARLSAYGVAGTNALTQALGSDFNTNASNASAGTTAVGQQIKTAADSTNRALDTLGTTFSSLNPTQTGGIPLTNNVANWIAEKFGQTALSSYKTNLADARSQLIGVLNSSGGTPTGNEATANKYLPDDMTKAQFDANVGTPDKPGIVRQLIDQKVGSFTQSGQQGGGSFSEGQTTSAGGYNFVYQNGKWIPK